MAEEINAQRDKCPKRGGDTETNVASHTCTAARGTLSGGDSGMSEPTAGLEVVGGVGGVFVHKV